MCPLAKTLKVAISIKLVPGLPFLTPDISVAWYFGSPTFQSPVISVTTFCFRVIQQYFRRQPNFERMPQLTRLSTTASLDRSSAVRLSAFPLPIPEVEVHGSGSCCSTSSKNSTFTQAHFWPGAGDARAIFHYIPKNSAQVFVGVACGGPANRNILGCDSPPPGKWTLSKHTSPFPTG